MQAEERERKRVEEEERKRAEVEYQLQKKKTKKEKQRAKKLAAKGGVGQPVSEDDKAPDVDDSPPSGMNTRHYLSTFLDSSPHYTSLFRGRLRCD